MSFQAPKALERDFERKLKKVAQNVSKIISAGSDATTIAYRLNVYADQLGPWADKVIAEVVSKSNRHNLKEWRALSKTISDKMRSFYTEGAVAHAMRDLSEVGAGLIKSLPIDAGKKAVEYAQVAASTGMRHEDLIEQIQGLSEITHARAQLIARTEVARQQSLLTQTRAVSIGSEGYIWRTAEDGRVRPSHAALNGKFIRWDDPPLVDGKYRAHAGQIFNCRCYPEPVVPDVTPQKAGKVVGVESSEAPERSAISAVLPMQREQKEALFKSAKRYKADVFRAFEDAPDDLLKSFESVNLSPSVSVSKKYQTSYVDADGDVYLNDHDFRRGNEGIMSLLKVPERFEPLYNASQVVRHEYGHSLDRALARRHQSRGLFSSQDQGFIDAFKKTEALVSTEAFKKSLNLSVGFSSKFKVNAEIGKNPALSDVLSALTSGAVQGYFGHPVSYWTWEKRLAEVFANLSDIYATGNRSLWLEVKSTFGDLASAYESIIKRAAVGGI